MGILRYIVQGIGWEIGRQGAREGIDALKEQADDVDDSATLSPREQKKLEKERVKAAARASRERDEAIARNKARIEDELRALKKKAER